MGEGTARGSPREVSSPPVSLTLISSYCRENVSPPGRRDESFAGLTRLGACRCKLVFINFERRPLKEVIMSNELFCIALAGNPNSGKTTVFNALTGARQHVANYPGVTVDKKEGLVKVPGGEAKVMDLPGTYSLSAYSLEELVARRALADERPDVVVDIIDANALERNLYLAVQLMEMGLPIVLALNMMDEVNKKGIKINVEKLAQLLGVPAVKTIARTGGGLDQLLAAASSQAEAHKGRPWAPLLISYGPDLDAALKDMTAKIEEASFLTDRYPARWIALKYLESDEEIHKLGAAADSDLHAALLAVTAEAAAHLDATLGTYPEAIIADYRYGYIHSILKQNVLVKPEDTAARVALSDRADSVLTHKFAGPLIMFGILYLVYKITFVIGEIPMGWVEDFFGWANEFVSAAMPDGVLKSLIVSGIIDGVGGLMGFVPLIMVIFLLISILDDSGYMARIAYMLDRVMRVFGLHGCSVMPLIVSGGIAGGCGVPGVMAARTLRSPKERLATILVAPFLACGAKLPVFLLLVGAFFAEDQAQIMLLMTLIGWCAALLIARLLRSTLARGEATPFVMELPPYRTPTVKGVAIHTWERTWAYIKKAGTVVLAVSILLWAAMTYPELNDDEAYVFEGQRAEIANGLEAGGLSEADAEKLLAAVDGAEAEAALRNSVAGRLGIALEPVSQISGFDWRTNIALIGGVAAKEIIVSTLGTAYSLVSVDDEDADAANLQARLAADPHWNPAVAAALMVFVLLYAPCFMVVIMIRQETGSIGWAAFSIVFNTIFAFAVSTGVYQVGKLLL